MLPGHRAASLVLVALASAGCIVAPYPAAPARRSTRFATDFTRSSSLEPPDRPRGCHVDVLFDGAPDRPHVVIGRVSASWLGQDRVAQTATEAAILPLLRREACRAGAHVLYRVVTSMEDHVQARGSGALLARSAHGTAVAAVYVLSDGAVAPPPRGPGRPVRRPRRLEGPEPEPAVPAPPAARQLEVFDPWERR